MLFNSIQLSRKATISSYITIAPWTIMRIREYMALMSQQKPALMLLCPIRTSQSLNE